MSIELDIINAVFSGFISKIISDGVDRIKSNCTTSIPFKDKRIKQK